VRAHLGLLWKHEGRCFLVLEIKLTLAAFCARVASVALCATASPPVAPLGS